MALSLENTPMQRQLIIALTALVLATFLEWYLRLPANFPFSFDHPPSEWLLRLYGIWGAFKLVLPGAVAGFVAGRHGLLLGALSGFLGNFACGLPLWLVIEAETSTYVVVAHVAAMSLSRAVVSAAGGGTWQLLRSYVPRREYTVRPPEARRPLAGRHSGR
jgi:hypothetical protein